MTIISGTAVDLLTPFPTAEASRIYGWKHCYRTLSDDDDVPVDRDLLISATAALLPQTLSAGIIDKTQLTSQRHEAPLVGMLMLIPSGTRDGCLHFASGRKAFKMGLVEEALAQWLPRLFEDRPTLLRVSALLDESNSPAKALLKRLGFRFEGVLQDAVLVGGIPRSRVMFGITRGQVLSRTEVVAENVESPTTLVSQSEVEEEI